MKLLRVILLATLICGAGCSDSDSTDDRSASDATVETAGAPPRTVAPLDEANAATYYYQAQAQLDDATGELNQRLADFIRSRDRVAQGYVERALQDHRQAVELFETGSRIGPCDFTLGQFDDVKVSNLNFDLTKYLGPLTCARLVLAKGVLALDANEIDQAMAAFATVLRFHHHCNHQPVRWFEMSLVLGSVVEMMLFPELEGLLQREGIGEATYADLLETMQMYGRIDTDLEDGLRGEVDARFNTVLAIFDPAALDALAGEQSDPAMAWAGRLFANQSLRSRYSEKHGMLASEIIPPLAQAYYEDLLTAFRQNDAEILERFITDYRNRLQADLQSQGIVFQTRQELVENDSVDGLMERWLEEDPELFFRVVIYLVDVWGIDREYIEAFAARRTYADLLTLGTALRLYERRTGSLPADLAALTPDYIPQVPADYFALPNKIIYKPTGKQWMIYSVGPNREDDWGVAGSFHSFMQPQTGLTPRAVDLVISSQ